MTDYPWQSFPSLENRDFHHALERFVYPSLLAHLLLLYLLVNYMLQQLIRGCLAVYCSILHEQ